MDRNLFQLSGGEKQRVACASVSAMRPDILVLDEPTPNLDLDAIETMRKTLKLWKQQGKTIVVAEHRIYWLKEICDRVLIDCKKDGKIQWDRFDGSVSKTFAGRKKGTGAAKSDASGD